MKIKFEFEDYDYFIYDDQEIIVISNKNSDNEKIKDLLIFGKIIRSHLKSEIVPVHDEEEYDEILKYYSNLKSAFLKEEENE